MLSKDHFYWGMARKYIIAFAHIINDIHVIRTDDNVIVKNITVPVTYAIKSKLFYHLQRNDKYKRRIKSYLPRISYIITGMEFDASRKTSNLNTCTIRSESGVEEFQYAGVPYNFHVEMTLWSMYMDDMLQIIEQIVTFFKPDYSMIVNEIEELGIKKSIPVTIGPINFDFDNEFDIEDRVLRTNIDFTIKGFLYPPVQNDYVIKHINAQMGLLPERKVLETIQLDWDEMNQIITVNIKDGQPYYEFTSNVDITTNTISTGDYIDG